MWPVQLTFTTVMEDQRLSKETQLRRPFWALSGLPLVVASTKTSQVSYYEHIILFPFVNQMVILEADKGLFVLAH